jgi:molecular chaperone HtpG
MPKIQTNFQGLVQLLAKNLYPEPDVFIRELIQNGHDAIQFRLAVDPGLAGRIDIITDARANTISFVDNGLGMNEDDIVNFLATIGTSGTGSRTKQLLDDANRDAIIATIGQFGIGFLSAFVVAEEIEVVTRKLGDDRVLAWRYRGGEEYDLAELQPGSVEPGTRVTLHLRSDQRGAIDEDGISKTVRKYADFLPVAIHLDGNGPINTIDAPWHREQIGSDDDYRRQLVDFINRRFPDAPLLIIPIHCESPRARGALYISDRHVAGINTLGLIDIFQNRMCIRLNDQELLPEWAKFVRGIVDSPDLMPTAARDNLRRDGKYHELRRHLGKLIIDSLIRLAAENPSKFSTICNWHHYHLKGMALHHDDFFDAVVEHLPFETNVGQLDLRSYVARQSARPGAKIPVYYFSFGRDSNQFYDLCTAQNIIAINTGRVFEEELIKKYVRKHARTLELRQLDTLHDERLFALLSVEEHRSYRRLEDAVRGALEASSIHNVIPVARRFKPTRMSSALIGEEKSEGMSQLEELLRRPDISDGLGELAAETLGQLRAHRLTLYLNVDNEIIQGLAQLENLGEDPGHIPFLLGVYSAAVLNAHARLTPDQARILYDQLQEHMRTSLELQRRVAELLGPPESTQTGSRQLPN